MLNNNTPTDFPTLEEAAAQLELEGSKSSDLTPHTAPPPEASSSTILPEAPPAAHAQAPPETPPQSAQGSMLQEEAFRLRESGLSIIPIKTDGSKAPAIQWKKHQSQRATAAQIATWCRKGYGLAVVGGEVSGNLEILDFDDSAAFTEWECLVKEAGGEELLKKMPTVITPSGGRHVYYCCKDGVEGNRKLAQKKVKGRPEVLIETRGEGDYVLLPESPPECHPLNQPYVLVRGDLSKIPTISGEQRSLLLEPAQALNEYVKPSQIVSGGSATSSAAATGNRPGDQFNAQATWEDILEPHGWKKAGNRGEVTDWRRPGKKEGISATTNFGGRDIFYNFTSNGHPFDADTGYSKFAAYAFLNHAGDFKAAAADLRDKGYGTAWPECSALPAFLPEAPPLDPVLLPPPLRGWIIDETERMQVPIEMVAIPAIVGLSSVVGRQIGIYPKKYDDWLVIPNLWGTVIARSGTMKSPAQERGLRPIERLVSQATQEYEEALAATLAEQEVYKIKIRVAKDDIKTALKAGDESEVAKLQNYLTVLNGEKSSRMPTERRYKTNDPTVEKLGEIIRQNPNGMMLIRDELSGWLRSLEKNGREGDREFYLESWSGKNSFTVDRIERGKIHIPALCMSIIGGIQPGKLEKYVHEALQQGWGDDGLLQRFQLGVYPEISKDWQNIDRPPDAKAFKRAMDVFQSLNHLKKVSLLGDVPALHFDSDAQEVFNAFLEQLEKRLRSDEIGCETLESHLSKYRSLMPALALLFYLASEGGVGKAVDLDSTMKAVDFCDFLEKHALKVYAGAIRPDLQSAHALARMIKSGKVEDGTTVRDIYRNHWSFLSSPVLVTAALEILEECGWVRIQIVQTDGRSTEIVELNPELNK